LFSKYNNNETIYYVNLIVINQDYIIIKLLLYIALHKSDVKVLKQKFNWNLLKFIENSS